ncbi:hypothetical protein FF100_29560 [Methylobacterium terricola]|uniref:3-phenylpropionate/cinnamic acid dioxygenase, small subunit n=1 Tax=Methylobacterium terricola TaxID=2583531 RepID=A0A5C4LA76_9HYPH|nr:aromatic-ring-hydroxylating dioxygenase subunit beta [Methylobacterium terricola]TNC08349.1 hypothetical protein FF100_29560 [Methylobacterium terricola]
MDATTRTAISLQDAMEVAWLEADLLDSADYDPWLALWTPDAIYVVPAEPAGDDFENTLNIAYDDAAMRAKRVERLRSGQSVSASPVARTVRLLSRFRILSSEAGRCELRCAQILTEYRRERERMHTADITFVLVRTPDGLRIARKVVRLINASDAITGVSYIL